MRETPAQRKVTDSLLEEMFDAIEEETRSGMHMVAYCIVAATVFGFAIVVALMRHVGWI